MSAARATKPKYYYLYTCFHCPHAPIVRSFAREYIVFCTDCGKPTTLMTRFILTETLASELKFKPRIVEQ